MKLQQVFLLLALLTGFQTFSSATWAQKLQQEEEAFREDRDGWIFVRVCGAPEKRGFDYGRLVAPEIHELIKTPPSLSLLQH